MDGAEVFRLPTRPWKQRLRRAFVQGGATAFLAAVVGFTLLFAITGLIAWLMGKTSLTQMPARLMNLPRQTILNILPLPALVGFLFAFPIFVSRLTESGWCVTLKQSGNLEVQYERGAEAGVAAGEIKSVEIVQSAVCVRYPNPKAPARRLYLSCTTHRAARFVCESINRWLAERTSPRLPPEQS